MVVKRLAKSSHVLRFAILIRQFPDYFECQWETSYLVIGKEPGQKLDEAKEQEVKIIDEKQFRKVIGQR